MLTQAGLTADMPIAELGRQMMAAQLAIIQEYTPALQQNAEVTAVHETRKAIRRTYTAVRLFRPYFEPGLLDDYRRRLRKLMKRLAPCRDTAVFLSKLQIHIAESGADLSDLYDYWQTRQAAADAQLRRYLARPQWAIFWGDYAAFTQTEGQGIRSQTSPITPVKAGHWIPALLYPRVAVVRAYDAYGRSHLTGADIKQLHRLRIACKELRYAFEFFAPLLGPEIETALNTLKSLQENLGNLNDARVALELLAQTPGRETAVIYYHDVQVAEIGRLLAEFHPLWDALTAPAWRQNLAAALAIL